MATPEVVLGASLLAMFLNLRINPGFWTIVIAHVMFCISFVVVTVKARIASLDPRLEQAAMDLYANERETFRFVTLPLVMPGIAGAALLAFSLSFDDFIITNFKSGCVCLSCTRYSSSGKRHWKCDVLYRPNDRYRWPIR
jgi:spermidine/putrescine transport system permease protein